MFFKKIEDMNVIELHVQELLDLVRELNEELRRAKYLLDDLTLKAQMSNCLLVVRKVGEDKLEKLEKILD